MSYELYWHGDPWAAREYLEARELKRAEENQRMWMQGLYNYKAVSAALEIFGYGLSGRKGARPSGYIADPIPITEKERKAAKQKKIQHTLDFVRKGQGGGA